jgi:hypothetical protein
METKRRLTARIVFNAAALIILLALVPLALADKGGAPNGGGGKGGASAGGSSSSTSSSSTLSLSSNYVQWNPTVSLSCLTEDDYDQRVFSGSLSGSYSTSYQLCGLNTDGLTAGGIGLESDVWVTGQLTDLTITSPDGSLHHAVPMGQSTSKGVTSYHYAVCYAPLYYLSTDTGTNPLQGGTWQITLSGQIDSATWNTRAQMTDATFQQNYCPPSEQNLLP